jgi:hypothetical protein
MSARHAPAISTLVRWRAFEEALAERSCQQASARVLAANDAHEKASAAADSIARRRDELLSAGALDLTLLQAVAEFEGLARDEEDRRREALRQRERERDEAITAHVDARTRTRVAETRRDRIVAEARDQEEKRLFDQMASLLVASAVDSHPGEVA